MPLCGSRLQGQSLEEVDCPYVRSVVSAVQSLLQQGAQPLLYGGHYSGAFLQRTYINRTASIELLLLVWRFLTGSFLHCFFCLWSICGKLLFPALGFIADESVSMLLRVWVHPPPPLYTDSITAAPEVPAIKGSRDEIQAEISIRQRGLETGLYSLVSFYNLSNRDEPLLCIIMLLHQ